VHYTCDMEEEPELPPFSESFLPAKGVGSSTALAFSSTSEVFSLSGLGCVFKAILAHSNDTILVIDQMAQIQFAGGSMAVLGYAAADLIGCSLFQLFPDETSLEEQAAFLQPCPLEQSRITESMALRRADGSTVLVAAVTSNYLVDNQQQGLLVSFRDITRQKAAEAKAIFLEHYDPLTGLQNRGGFTSQVAQAITVASNRSRLFCVMAIGLDRFRRINDLYGTETGDLALVAVARQLQQAMRADDVVSRFRGDKFFSLCLDIRSHENVKAIIAKVQSSLDFSPPGTKEDTRLSASIGIAFYPNDGLDAPGLIRSAETAMYMAKESGRDSYRLYDANMNEALLDRQRVEAELNTAIRQEQFEPYFQPKVDRQGYLLGAEALIRWRLPSGQIRPPSYFISLAEANGFIDQIGAIMLRKTCQAVAGLHKRKLMNVPVSINLSPRQFAQPLLVDDIRQAMAEADLPPEMIELEITESGIMENQTEGISKLNQLKALGVLVSIDDFGTGYSSFSKLKDYPVDIIKMDKSFVDPLPHDRRATIIASAIVDLAHTLSFSVVAEGVETMEQLRFLDTIFCDSYQGYLFSKPLSLIDFEGLLILGRPLPAVSYQ